MELPPPGISFRHRVSASASRVKRLRNFHTAAVWFPESDATSLDTWTSGRRARGRSSALIQEKLGEGDCDATNFSIKSQRGGMDVFHAMLCLDVLPWCSDFTLSRGLPAVVCFTNALMK